MLPGAYVGDRGAQWQKGFRCTLGVHGNSSVCLDVDRGHTPQMWVKAEERPSTSVAVMLVHGHVQGAGQLE